MYKKELLILCRQKISKSCQIWYEMVRKLYTPVHRKGQIENRFGLSIFIFAEMKIKKNKELNQIEIKEDNKWEFIKGLY